MSSYHCFHFAPMICLHMWKHHWVAPWPKRHAGEEYRWMMNISCPVFLLFNKPTSCTTLDPSCKTNTVCVCESQRKLLTVTEDLLFSPEMTQVPCFSLFSCLHVPGNYCTWLFSHTQWVVLLCCLATVPLLW